MTSGIRRAGGGALFLMLAACGDPGTEALDAGPDPVDAWVAVDGGEDVDAGGDEDASVDSDAAVDTDAGLDMDAGLDTDAGSDAGVGSDAGMPRVSWSRAYGNGGAHTFRDAALLPDGSVVIVGYTPVFGAGGNEAIATRIDREGNVLWAQSFGGSAGDALVSVALTDDGDLIATGETTSFGPRNWAAFVVRFSIEGEVRWQRAIAAASANYSPNSIRALSGDRYLVSGHSLDNGVALITIDGSGAIVAQNGARGGNVFDGIRLADGTFVIAGQSAEGTSGSYYGELARVRGDGGDVWRIRVNQNATEENNVFRSVIPAHEGGVVATGTASLRFGYTRTRVWVVSVADNGTIRWQRTYGGAGVSEGWKIVATADGGYVVFGRTSAFGEATRWRAWVLKLNAAGNVLWTRVYTEAGRSQGFHSGVVTDDGEIVAVGVSDVPSNGSYYSGYVVRVVDSARDAGPCSAEPDYFTDGTAISLSSALSTTYRPMLVSSAGAATIADIPLAVRAVCATP